MNYKEITAKNILYHMYAKGLSRKTVCDDLGIKYTTFSDWVNAKTHPGMDKVEMLANYFGVSKADLVEDQSKRVETEQEREWKKLQETADKVAKVLAESGITYRQVDEVFGFVKEVLKITF